MLEDYFNHPKERQEKMHQEGQDILEKVHRVPHLSPSPSKLFYIGLIFPNRVTLELLKTLQLLGNQGSQWIHLQIP